MGKYLLSISNASLIHNSFQILAKEFSSPTDDIIKNIEKEFSLMKKVKKSVTSAIENIISNKDDSNSENEEVRHIPNAGIEMSFQATKVLSDAVLPLARSRSAVWAPSRPGSAGGPDSNCATATDIPRRRRAMR